MKYYNNKARQAGMTLIELTVVLLILIGLAGMLIPYVSGFVAKTHQATSGQTINALNSAIQRHEAQFFGQPDRLDSLITTGGAVAVTLPGGGQYAPIPYVTATDTNFITALTAAGIVNVLDQPVVAPGANVTFDIGTARAVNADGTVLGFSAAGITAIQSAIGRPAGENFLYVVLGVGQSSGLAGRTLQEAPTHFHEGNHNYAAAYGRFLAVYGVPTTTAAGVSVVADATGDDAKFLGVVGPMNPVEGAAGHILEYREDSFGS